MLDKVNINFNASGEQNFMVSGFQNNQNLSVGDKAFFTGNYNGIQDSNGYPIQANKEVYVKKNNAINYEIGITDPSEKNLMFQNATKEELWKKETLFEVQKNVNGGLTTDYSKAITLEENAGNIKAEFETDLSGDYKFSVQSKKELWVATTIIAKRSFSYGQHFISIGDSFPMTWENYGQVVSFTRSFGLQKMPTSEARYKVHVR